MSERLSAAVALLDWDETPLRTIQSADWRLEDRDDSTNRIWVTTSLAEDDGIQSDQELIYDGRRFAVAEVDRDRAQDRAVITADEVQAELSGFLMDEFVVTSWTLTQAVEHALQDTRWTLGDVVGVRYGRANFEEITVLEALQFLARHQDARISFDSLRRRVNVSAQAGVIHEHVFTYGRELENIEKSEVAPRTTVIYPTGADGMTIEEVNDGQDFVADFGYYISQGLTPQQAWERFRKEDDWEDNRYEIAENLKRDAEKRLAEEAYPQITYILTATATQAVDGEEDFDLRTLHLGDQVYVWDQEIDAKLRAEVTAVTTSSDASENKLILSALPDSLGASVEGRYFGDSGRPADGPGRRRSAGPQPRPSMPILESINDLGVGEFRWNGQDHQGNYSTIPVRFGDVRTVAGPLDGGAVPSPNSEDNFWGTSIAQRGGGISKIAFGAPGEFAVWFQMVGWDGETRSLFSEPLVVEVEALVDTEAIREQLDEAQERIDQAREELDEAMERVEQIAEQWDEADFPQLKADLEESQERLDHLRDVQLPALDDALGSLQSLADDHDQRIDSARDAADSARDMAENLRDVQLPALNDALNNVEAAVQDYDARITAAQAGADSARATAETLRDETLPVLEGRLVDNEDAIADADTRLAGARSDIDNLRDVALPGLENTLESGLEDAYEWRNVGAISATSVRIGDYENLLPEDYLWELRQVGISGTPLWGATQGGAAGWVTILNQAGIPINLRFNFASHTGSITRIAFNGPSGQGLRVAPGEDFSLSARGFAAGANPSGSISLTVRYSTDSGAFVSRVNIGSLTGGSFSHAWTVPENTDINRMQLEFTAQANAGGNAHFGNFRFRRRVGGELIVDGSIGAQHIMAQEIAAAVGQFLNLTADQIDTENLAAHLATIIELDAGQIVSGQISTARLDAQSVAAAVANFLTLDALEINVEELAGQIANVIEITSESIASGAISARHLAIADFDNLITDEHLWDLRSEGTSSPLWSATTGGAAGWLTILNQVGGIPVLIRYNAASNSGTSRLAFSAGGQGIPVKPGDEFYFACDGWRAPGSPFGSIQLQARYLNGAGGYVSRSTVGDFYTNGMPNGTSWTVPSNTDIRRMQVEFTAYSTAEGNAHFGAMTFRRKSGGELIVDGSIQARHIVADSIAAAVAQFIDLEALNINFEQLAGEVANIIDITAEVIGAGTIGTEQLIVGPQNMVTDRAFATLGEDGSPRAWRNGSNANWYPTTAQTADGYPLVRLSQADAESSENFHVFYGGWNASWAALPCEPGDEFRISWRVHRYAGASDNDDYHLSWAWADADGQQISAHAFPQGAHPTSNRSSTFTAPPGAVRFRIWFAKIGSASGARGFAIRSLQKKTHGDLLVDGTILARHIVAEEIAGAVASFLTLHAGQITTGQLHADRVNISSLFANNGFISTLRTRVIEAIQITTQRIITGDIIATGTIDVEHLNVTQQMTAALGQFLEIEAGSIASNFIRGMTIEGGLVTGTTVRGSTFETHSQNNRGITIRDNGSMEVRPGVAGGGPITFMIDTQGNVEATGEFVAMRGGQEIRLESSAQYNRPQITLDTGNSSQSQPNIYVATESGSNFGPGSFVMGGREATRNSSGRADLILKHGGDFELKQNHGTFNQIGIHKGGRFLELWGRSDGHPGFSQIYRGRSGNYSSTGTQRVSITYGYPVPVGAREVQATVRVSQGSMDNFHTRSISTSYEGASGFTFATTRTNDGGSSYRVDFMTMWI